MLVEGWSHPFVTFPNFSLHGVYTLLCVIIEASLVIPGVVHTMQSVYGIGCSLGQPLSDQKQPQHLEPTTQMCGGRGPHCPPNPRLQEATAGVTCCHCCLLPRGWKVWKFLPHPSSSPRSSLEAASVAETREFQSIWFRQFLSVQ